METKSYFASSVPAALEVARRELGPEAMLVGSRPAPPQARPLGRLEVTFAWDSRKERIDRERRLSQPRSSFSSLQESGGGLPPECSEIDDIRRQIKALRSVVGKSAPGKSERDFLEQLTMAGFDPDAVAGLVNEAAKQSGDARTALADLLTQYIRISPFKSPRSGESRTMALVGPPGRGKSTTLIKIAISRGIACHTPVRVYTAGPHGVGDTEKMARYCSILGAPHQCFESLPGLELALRGEAWKGLTLIDTPGLSPSDSKEAEPLAELFDRRPEIEKHLVLRAEARYADMLAVTERFAELRPNCLLFTGMDETCNFAAMASLLVRTSLPMTFAGTGQRIPEDLADADAVGLIHRVLSPLGLVEGLRLRSAAAA